MTLTVPHLVGHPRTEYRLKRSQSPVKVIRKYAVQGHPVPAAAYRAHGPFPAEVLARPRMQHEDIVPDPNGHRVFRCRDCGELIPWDSLQDHECEEQ